MPARPRRPSMPKLAPFALMEERPPRKTKPLHLFLVFLLFFVPLFLLHAGVLTLPYFWDELGQFVPSALDLLRTGALVAHSAIPNVHPPGVAAYLALAYKIFGFSTVTTRSAMLVLAACGLLLVFLLAIELAKGSKGAPAFLPPLLLLISPLFFTQSMLAQLDMPCMVLTLAALLFFIEERYAWCVAACVAAVLAKETAIVTPFVFFCALAWRKDWKRASWFLAPAGALFAWLLLLHHKTGYWLGNAEFARYNVSYALAPARMFIGLVRRLFYLLIAEMRLVGTIAIAVAVRRVKAFHTRAWAVTAAVGTLNVLLVSFLGGAELERYLLPALPLFYIAVGVALSGLPRKWNIAAAVVQIAALAFFTRWNPPYPFPFENNYAMVDFLHLQQSASEYVERNLQGRKIATAWPYTAGLRNPDFDFVQKKIRTVETRDLRYSSVAAIPDEKFDTLIVYTREWAPAPGVTDSAWVRVFLRRFYQWEPDITLAQCTALGLEPLVGWSARGQSAEIYIRRRPRAR